MQDLVTKRATYAEYCAVPPHLVAEIVGGRLVTHPRPAPRQSSTASRLGVVLGHAFDWKLGAPGGWWIIDEPELHLDDDILIPDLAGWRRERMPRLPDTAWFELTPDWACEVLSPSTMRHDKGEKRDIYAANGITHLWHVDVAARVLEVFELAQGRWVLDKTLRDDDSVAASPFDAAPFDLALLWDE